MFILTICGGNCRHHLYDIDTLEDLLYAVMGDESEANRIATIAANMKAKETFHNKYIYLKCMEEV